MYWLMNVLSSTLRGLLKLALVVLTFALGVVLLMAAIAVVAISAVWSLLRGRKPAIYTTYTHFKSASQAFRRGGGWPNTPGPAAGVDVVDVQAHEVHDAPPRAIEREQPPR
jgi:hypothetical protein